MYKYQLFFLFLVTQLSACMSTSTVVTASENEVNNGSEIQSNTAKVEHTALIQSFPLYQGDIPGTITSSKVESNARKGQKDAFIIDITQPVITAYFPKIKNEMASAVIICPGGAYFGLSMDKEGEDVARRLNSLGITAFVLKYRMPSDDSMTDKKNGPLQDVQQAFAFVRENSEQWQLNRNKLGVMGFSAGGHLASSAAVHFNHPVLPQHTEAMVKPNFQILIYPVISMIEGITHKGSRTNLLGNEFTASQLAYYSNEQQVTATTPKAFIVHATDDNAVPVENSLNYYQALREQQINTQLLILPSGGHGFGMRHQFDWFKSLTMWLENNQLL